MDSAGFVALFQALAQEPLTDQQVASLRSGSLYRRRMAIVSAFIEQAAGQCPWPHCGCPRHYRCGQANGLQRYRCMECGRSYNALTGTPLARLRHRGKWLSYLQCLLDLRTVRDAARRVAVARSTSFRWPHRFIAGVRRERPAQLSGAVEADETCLLESQKGSRQLNRPARRRGGKAARPGISREMDCIPVARDRGRTTHEFVTGRGPVSAWQLAPHLLPVLSRDVLLISDGAKAYGTFARGGLVTHEAINGRGGIHVRGAIHLNNVNGWHSRFNTWLRRFHGVASRYLANYTGWQRVLDTAEWTLSGPLAANRCRQKQLLETRLLKDSLPWSIA
ncbi:IS1595 family transposase [Pseudoduganella dura]|uniref:IS1595 family transposase n=1 Tax=Pseudoduganella dura TaxID=321982 RepID=UPI0019C2ECEB|nr:IS1595 family transposase [Pseudoduganella dura]GGX82283.1 transposase [Pseudoduganella dura]